MNSEKYVFCKADRGYVTETAKLWPHTLFFIRAINVAPLEFELYVTVIYKSIS